MCSVEVIIEGIDRETSSRKMPNPTAKESLLQIKTGMSDFCKQDRKQLIVTHKDKSCSIDEVGFQS